MLIYFLKVIICTAIFYGLYALLLHREKMLVFNRFYLLSSLIISFLIPLITLTVKAPVSVIPEYSFLTNIPTSTVAPGPVTNDTLLLSIPLMPVLISGIVSIFFLVRLIFNFYKIRKARSTNENVFYRNTRIVLLKKDSVPYSFWDTIYLSKTEFENGNIEAEVLEHELAHIRQKHSWDILLTELITVVTWFNPVLYFFKRAIKINHELLADAEVISHAYSIQDYKNILLQRAARLSDMGLVSSFNFILTKKRLIMLQKQFNKKRSMLLGISVLPVLGVAIFMGAGKISRAGQTTAIDMHTYSMANDTIPKNKSAVNKEENKSVPFATHSPINSFPEGPGASEAEIREYESLLGRGRDSKGTFKWNKETKITRVLDLYEKMTYDQRKKVTPLPPPPPPPPLPPKAVTERPRKNNGLPENIRSVSVKIKQSNRKDSTATIHYKDGSSKEFDISTPSAKAEFIRKFGNILPPPPPPAPPKPVRKSVNNQPPPPPPLQPLPVSAETLSRLSEWPVILESVNGKHITSQKLEDIRLPKGTSNIIIKTINEKPEKAFLIYPDRKVQIIDISTTVHRKNFKEKFGIDIPQLIPALPKS